MKKIFLSIGFCLAAGAVWAQTIPAGLEWRVDGAGITITGYTGGGVTLTIPDRIGGNPVTAIGDYAFITSRSLTSITFPSFPAGLTSIGAGAFAGCKKLQTISLPAGLTSIGYGAFTGCESLRSITLPAALTHIGDYAFSRCLNLERITFPAALTSIGAGAFKGCSTLTSITLPPTLTSIGVGAFAECKNLGSINLPAGLTIIEFWAFSECSSLSSITLSRKTSVEKDAFPGSAQLTYYD